MTTLTPIPQRTEPDWSALATLAPCTIEPTINAPAARASLYRFGLRLQAVRDDEKRLIAWNVVRYN